MAFEGLTFVYAWKETIKNKDNNNGTTNNKWDNKKLIKCI